MKTYKSIIYTFTLFFAQSLFSQNISFPDDALQRGYYNKPYFRYEAESGKCESNGDFLSATYDQREIQSEASNQVAVNLIAKDSHIQWTNSQQADGLTIRFSLPDSPTGTGSKGTLALYVNNEFVQNILLDSYWAWQYILKSGSKYPDNTPDATTKFPRMRFDETHVKLSSKIPENAVIKLVKIDDNTTPYTIDFIELENVAPAVSFESIQDQNKIAYSADQGDIALFIMANKGKTIYIPEGRFETDKRILISSASNTKIIGAGSWYSEIYFTASSDVRSTYNQRGIEAYGDNILISGLFLNTVNNKRYYQNNDSYQVGKGLMGSFGNNSVIRDLWAEHFECGGWIENANNLLIQNCRFRNNYADGMNYSYGTKNSILEYCSFRNNGDDDIATWSRSTGLCQNNIFRYSTAENNWRASSLGFFGGKQNKAYNCVIIDPMEAGFRVTCDFPGMPFSTDGYNEMYNISVYRGGVAAGTVGISGDLWGNQQGALHLSSSSQYDLLNFYIHDIDLYNSKNDAIFIGSGSKYIRSLVLKDINIYGTGRYGLYFSSTKGDGTYCNINYNNIGAASNSNQIPSAFTFTEDCDFSDVPTVENNNFKAKYSNGKLQISGQESGLVALYDTLGKLVLKKKFTSSTMNIDGISPGLYVIAWRNPDYVQKISTY